jgi:hypothetical protein
MNRFGEMLKHGTHVGGEEHILPPICWKCKGKKKIVTNEHAPSSSLRVFKKCNICNGKGRAENLRL